MSAVIKISLPLGLLVVYVVGALIWYELLRAELVHLLGRQRGGRGRRHRRRAERAGEAGAVAVADEAERAQAAELAPPALEPAPAELVERAVNVDGDPGQEAADGAAGDEARMHYYLARKAAAAERDAAVGAAKEVTRRAVERIERRYGQAGSATDGHAAGKAAKAERDAAVEAAKEASKQAIERIERRYREIDWALEDEEDERIREKLEHAER
ncbi:MAG TPA: hypothetical protein VK680_08335 [Solirubrobacteraceae bacterium]|jgi:hypothetical protein|nr:hypothetical protein [Solirubrobacteraceae bacterium]